jgi:phospholipase A1
LQDGVTALCPTKPFYMRSNTNWLQHSRALLLFLFSLCTACLLQAQPNNLFSKYAQRQTMAERWELDDSTRKGTFLVTPYKPVYVTAGRWSNKPNQQPHSENPAYSLPFPVEYNHYEAKFQLSLKTKIAQQLFCKKADLWVGYTQKAHWQLYNVKLSRPFRELNYEPEVILNFPVKIPLGGFTIRMLGVAINHQSNGRTMPLSRSWNRVVFHAGLERRNWQLYIRPWIRLPDDDDENPDVTSYIGNGELVAVHTIGKHQLSVVGTHTLFMRGKSRGSLQANWVLPVMGNLRAQVQFFDGYGETLIDYNHHQTTIGLSVALIDW